MTLTVTAPGPNPITTFDSGLKIVRLTDYIGAARGTLSIVADADSPAGTVLRDTQELAPATTFAGRGASVADTASIPVADLSIGANAFYFGYIGVRVVGRPPVGARATEKWQFQDLPPGPSIARVHNSTVNDYFKLPRSFYSGYQLLRAGTYSPGFATNLRFRAFGITGGSMEFYMDLLYLIPSVLASTDDAGSFNADEYPPLTLWANNGGDLGFNDDHNTNNSIGAYQSYMPDYYFDSVFDWDVSYDIQDDDYEKGVADWNQIFSIAPERQVSWIYFKAGSRLVDAYTIETEDFSAWPSSTPMAQSGETSEGYMMETGVSGFPGNNTSAPGGPWSPAWYLMNSTLEFLGPDRFSGFGILPLGADAGAVWSMGAMTGRGTAFPGGAANPQNFAPLLQGFDSIIQLYKVNLMMANAGADVEMHFGTARWSAINTAHQTRVTVTAKVIHHADGTHSIALESDADSSTGRVTFVSPVTVMGALTPGTSYWVRVEKRFHNWRARCWIDGDAEPSTWDVEGFPPAWVTTATSGGFRVPVAAPYDTNWPTNVTNVYEDPRYWHGSSIHFSSPTPWMHEAGLRALTGFDTDNYTIQIEEFELSYDPDFPDNSGSYTGAYFRLEKYDGSVDWGTAYIPPGSWRVVVSDYAPHHFDNDTHGGNVFAWKESGAHPLQAAAWEIFNFRRPARQPRWADITYP